MTLSAIRRAVRVLAACCLTLTACGQGGETAPSSPQPSSPPSDVDVTLEHMEALPPPPARTPSPLRADRENPGQSRTIMSLRPAMTGNGAEREDMFHGLEYSGHRAHQG